jgi:lysine 2,3-aminomutase
MKLSCCIETGAALRERLGLEPQDLERVLEAYPMRITPLVEEQIRREGGAGPISLQYVPSVQELEDPVGQVDPLAEEEHSPVPNLVHRYPDRVLLLVTNECAVYCRFCTRKRRVGHPMRAPQGWLDAALRYIERTESVRDVLLSGGDPLLLSDAKLDRILVRLQTIAHVEIVRIGTRIPIVMPDRVTEALTALLRARQPLYLMLHVNHPDELAPETESALLRLADTGVPLLAQTVLLRGINDSAPVLRRLFHRLLRLRVRPYHLMQGDLTCGTDHFRTSVQTGLDLVQQLQGHTTGFAVPAYVVDLPGGGGKVVLGPQAVVEHTDTELIVRNYQGRVLSYPEPVTRDRP